MYDSTAFGEGRLIELRDGEKRVVRSLERSDERLNHVLDVLVQSSHALTVCPNLDAALVQITNSFAQNFADYCCIEVAIDGVERYECCVAAGTPVAASIQERFDAFMLPDDRVAISVGDVAGHGLDAAVTTRPF